MGVGAWEQAVSAVDYLVASPSTGLVSSNWALQLVELVKPGTVKFLTWRGLPFDVARNQLVRDAQELKARFLFFLDTDVLPPPDVLPHLTGRRLPIISGLLWAKLGYPAVWRQASGRQSYVPITRLPADALVEVHAIPMGCCLIDMRVFDVIPEPWFTWKIERPSETHPGKVSEDFDFCEKARSHGFRLWVDTGIRCMHETLVPVDPFGADSRDLGVQIASA